MANETLSEARQKFEAFYEEAYAGELKSILERQAAWKFWKTGGLQGLEEAIQIAGKVAHEITGNSNVAYMKRYAIVSVVAVIREKANG